jgi:hypothetical protein
MLHDAGVPASRAKRGAHRFVIPVPAAGAAVLRCWPETAEASRSAGRIKKTWENKE